MTTLRALHVVDSLHARHGGPSRSIPALCESLGALGCSIDLATRSDASTGELRFTNVVEGQFGWTAAYLGAAANGELARLAHQADLIHDHGLWLASNHAAARVARALDRPRIVSIRGMLSSWALRHRRFKKSIAWRIYQRRDLMHADVLHATSADEADEIRRCGLRQPIALIPNGISIPPHLETLTPSHRERRRALFLSRLHAKKGAGDLLEAWAEVHPPGWELVFAGPDAGEGFRLRQRVKQLGLSSVLFLDSQDDHNKWQLYKSADLFILPTRSENFGLVIGEALAAGVPVITTTGAPWPWLETYRCGWRINLGVAALANCLGAALSLPRETLQEMGRRGRAVIEEQFSWPTIGRSVLSVYDWMCGRGPRPPQVLTG